MAFEPTVFVVEDDPGVRTTLQELLQSVMLAVECFESAEDFLAVFDSSRPGCLVVDVRMPGMSGLDMLQQLESEEIVPPAIVITGHGDVPMTVKAMKQGAFDFLEKPYQPQELLDSINKAISLNAKQRSECSRRKELSLRLNRLLPEEKAVLKGILAGKTNETIAQELDVSLRTVQYRRASIMRKMEVDSKSELFEMLLPKELLADSLMS